MASSCSPSSRPIARRAKRITGYEYAVLVTNTDYEILTLGQLYRDRADAENAFDELKNQWGWGGFTTHDLHRCQLAARAVALIYNWWSLFVRLANPEARREAITSRPWLMSSVGRRTEHAGQTTITLTGLHAHFGKARAALTRVSALLQGWAAQAAEQLNPATVWHRLCDHLKHILAGIGPPQHPPSARESCKRNRLTEVFRFKATSERPWIETAEIDIATAQAAYLVFRMRASGTPVPLARLSWKARADEPEDPARGAGVMVIPDGRWHIYAIPLHAHPAWRSVHRVRSLRFQPIATSGIVEIERFEVIGSIP